MCISFFLHETDDARRKLGLDLVPRLGTLAVDPHKIGIVSLHQVHVNSAENAKAASVSCNIIFIFMYL